MGLRPAHCYTKLKRPNTRVSQRVPRKSYVVGVPEPKIRQFEGGDSKGSFDLEISLVSKKGVQIRHNALEAARTNANKYLAEKCGPAGYFFRVVVYPYHVMRENAMATGAGADRLQSGMAKSFGSPVGGAARVKEGQTVIVTRVNREHERTAREALRRAAAKMPTACAVVASPLAHKA